MRFLIFSILIVSGPSLAEEWDSYDQEALQKTQELLNNSSERDRAVQADPQALKADQNAKSLFGGDARSTDEVYKLASEVFGDVAKESGGDAKAMQELLMRYQADPAGFAKTWTPEQREALKKLSEKVRLPAAPAR